MKYLRNTLVGAILLISALAAGCAGTGPAPDPSTNSTAVVNEATNVVVQVAQIQGALNRLNSAWPQVRAAANDPQGNYSASERLALAEAWAVIDAEYTRYGEQFSDATRREQVISVLQFRQSVDRTRASWVAIRQIVQAHSTEISQERLGLLHQVDVAGIALVSGLDELSATANRANPDATGQVEQWLLFGEALATLLTTGK